MNTAVFDTILASGFALMMPVLWAGLGELIEQRAGIINVGIEGTMLTGAYAASTTAEHSGSHLLGLIAGIGAGIACAAVLGYLFIVRVVDQLIAGLMFTLMALGLTTVLFQKHPSGSAMSPISPVRIPGLSLIPVVGVIFHQTLLVYLAIAAAIAVWYFLDHTWAGLHIRAAGNRPRVAATAGVNVRVVRFHAMLLAGGLIGLGGAALVLTETNGFIAGVTSDQGFVALALVMFAGWNSLKLAGAAVLFGLAEAMQYAVQNIESLNSVPRDLWLSLPYVATIIVLAVTRARSAPAALGVPLPRAEMTGSRWRSTMRRQVTSPVASGDAVAPAHHAHTPHNGRTAL